MDAVEHFLAQWAREKPDLDVSAMGVLGRLSRAAVQVQDRLERVFAAHGFQAWEFDVLATLRRSGPPYELTPGQLDRMMMITSGTMTHRLGKLEARGFVERRRDEQDRRVIRVRLTDTGFQAFDAAHEAHRDNEDEILAGLTPGEREKLLSGLVALTHALGDVPPPA